MKGFRHTVLAAAMLVATCTALTGCGQTGLAFPTDSATPPLIGLHGGGQINVPNILPVAGTSTVNTAPMAVAPVAMAPVYAAPQYAYAAPQACAPAAQPLDPNRAPVYSRGKTRSGAY